LFDQLVRQLPEGVYLKSIKQNGKIVTLQGYAQSNARVSTLMRNLEESPWLEAPNLVEVKAVTVNNLRANEFTLTVVQPPPQQAVPTSQATPKGKKP
jgi:type IV pilus assembly protein PilN